MIKTKEDWDRAFLGHYAYQAQALDYMVEDIEYFRSKFKDHGFDAKDWEIICFWEAWSSSMDGSWLSVMDLIKDKIVSFFLQDPERYWNNPLDYATNN
jgi:hypothetical protein